jgi:hypothetical protein
MKKPEGVWIVSDQEEGRCMNRFMIRKQEDAEYISELGEEM